MSDVDIICVGFGPATAGFLSVLAKEAAQIESRAVPGMPLQVICYERADDIGFGVSGVVTRARGIRASMPDLDVSQIPMASAVRTEKVAYLLDPIGASRRSGTLPLADGLIRQFGARGYAVELPYIPPFLRKHDGFILSLGQFLQHVGGNLMGSGAVQIWPGSPIDQLLMEDGKVSGIRMVAGMDIRADLTVVGDGPVGVCGRQLNQAAPQEWAVGMKMVVDLPEGAGLEQGTVIHTFGFPEPEIFGFLYVHPGNVASVGIFVPSWLNAPAHTAYRYLQHFVTHPYLWRHLKGGRMRSWGAKSLQESGRRAEPVLAGDGWARIGEGSGSTNVLTGSGVDEAWTTGTQLGEGVLELLRAGRPLDRAGLENAYVGRRRASWVEQEARIAERARDGFHRGLLPGLFGMALTGFTNGKLSVPVSSRNGAATVRERCSWPEIAYDGQLLVSHQDALLMGGKVQATAGFEDHVRFTNPTLCETCADKLCAQMCSGQAISRGEGAVPAFDREKCVHCGACLWNCRQGALDFRAGAGGLHSNEN
jgi:electron-transferring-flavoprotein dehydrogenase